MPSERIGNLFCTVNEIVAPFLVVQFFNLFIFAILIGEEVYVGGIKKGSSSTIGSLRGSPSWSENCSMTLSVWLVSSGSVLSF